MTTEKSEPSKVRDGPFGAPAERIDRRRQLQSVLSWIAVVLLAGFFAVLIGLEFHLF